MKTYVIERVIPNAGDLSAEELQGISKKSNEVLCCPGKKPVGVITSVYLEGVHQKFFLLSMLGLGIIGVGMVAISQGAYGIPVMDVFHAIMGHAEGNVRLVVMNIRLPRVVAALVCGWGLSLSGLCIQSLLRNPLGSPITLGISHGAAFGASAAIVVFGAGMVSVTAFAFTGGMAATVIVLILARFKRLSPVAIILVGVALHSLFLSGTYLVQYLATETELAKVVFWTFGDVARSSWPEIWLLTGVVILATLFMVWVRWDMNAMAAGDATAKGLGVSVERIRLAGLVTATLVAALATCFHGIIGFLGLVAPHTARRLVGDDHGLLIPFSAVIGALLLLSADTVGRLLIGSGSMPVGVITSFLGAPMFLYILVKGER
jgi:iron complex transport system permease protein